MVDELVMAIANAPFREIFLVTKMKTGRCVIRLKLLLVIAELYMFNSLYCSESFAALPRAYELPAFLAYFSANIDAKLLARMDGCEYELLYGDYGIIVGPDKGVRIRMYEDRALQFDAMMLDHEVARALPSDFLTQLTELKREAVFRSGLAFPIANSALKGPTDEPGFYR